jgi:ubiquinone biosynthesis protein
MIIISLVRFLRIVCKYRLYCNSSLRAGEAPRGNPALRASKMDCHVGVSPPRNDGMVILCLQLLEFIFYPSRIFKKPQTQDFGIRLREALTELGPVYIKFGQVLSTSPTLVGPDTAKALQSLQDRLPAFDILHVKEAIYNSFGSTIEDLFEQFDLEPVSAASIAQVHRAVTKDNETVAVKILRPGIHKQYNDDIALLYFIAKTITKICPKYKRLKLIHVVDVFKQTMQQELDLKLEAANASELFDNYMTDLNIYIPKIYWDLTTKDIITTEWIDGISIYNEAKIKEYKLSRRDIATKIGLMFFNQAFRDGFFHADLHPGNILIMQDGSIALVDFGIMGRLEKKDRFIMAEILFKFFKRDYIAVAKLHLKAGYIPANTDIYLFAQSCRMIYEPLINVPFHQVIVADLLAHLFKITKEFGMETQEQLILLQKTMIVVEGIGRILTPEVNLWELAKPWIAKWAEKNIGPRAKILDFAKAWIEEVL